jgi:DNA-binding MarR family transcriptional regulator
MIDKENMSLNEHQINILKAINQGITSEKEIANTLQIDKHSVRYYLQDFDDNKFIQGAKGFVEGELEYVTCRLTDKGRVAVENPSNLIKESTMTEHRTIDVCDGNYNERIERDYVQGNVYHNCNVNISQETKEQTLGMSISQEIPIIDDCRKILQALAAFFKDNPNSGTGDSEISEALKINIHKVRVCLQELSKQGYIELRNADSLAGKYWIVIGLTSQGWVSVNT